MTRNMKFLIGAAITIQLLVDVGLIVNAYQVHTANNLQLIFDNKILDLYMLDHNSNHNE